MSFSAKIFGGIFSDSDTKDPFILFKDMGIGNISLSTADDVFLLQGQAPQSGTDFDNHTAWSETLLMVFINKGPNPIDVTYTDGPSGNSTTQRVVDYAVMFDVSNNDLVQVIDSVDGTSEYICLLVGRK